jgi:hypothetical protein
MNGDSIQIMAAIGDMKSELQKDIGGLKADLAGAKGTFSTEIKSLHASVQELKDENVREGWKSWLERGGIIAGALTLHKIATAIGWRI